MFLTYAGVYKTKVSFYYVIMKLLSIFFVLTGKLGQVPLKHFKYLVLIKYFNSVADRATLMAELGNLLDEYDSSEYYETDHMQKRFPYII